MTRGEVYRVRHPSSRDPKRARVFVVVSRQALMESRFSTVTCAPVYSRFDGLATQVPIGQEEGLKHESSVHCDELMSLLESLAHSFRRHARTEQGLALDAALRVALALD